MSDFNLSAINERINKFSSFVQPLQNNLNRIVVGQKELLNKIIICMLADGHLLLEGVPGLAKTLTVNTLADSIDTKFQRIQFTPDMLPADLLGTLIYNQKSGEFDTRKGPIFSNIILADEINRSPAKVQSALLESMQEKQVTIGEETYKLNLPFLVLATQNPIEQEGTYPLPEAQLDRFMFSIVIDYPSLNDELQIVKNTTTINHQEINKVLNCDDILNFQKALLGIPITNTVYSYAVDLVRKTRPNTKNCPEDIKKFIDFGAGPRASQYLIFGSKMHAVLRGKYSPDIEDVRAVSEDVLRHRLVKNYKAEAEGVTIEKIIQNLF